jgi:hypothetical protein
MFKSLHFLLGLCIVCLVSGCEKSLDLKQPATDPISIFNEVYTVMDQRYALFGIKEVNWQQVYEEFAPQVNNSLSSRELFLLIGRMLEKVKDGHVALISAADTLAYDDFYRLYPVNYNYNNVLQYYLKNDYQQSGPFLYKIVENVAYLNYASFGIDFTKEELDKVITDIQSTKGLILDVRSNPGGRLRNVDELFSRFLREKLLVKYEVKKKGPGHDDFAEPVPYYISPAQLTYQQPVIVLTNRSCFSACNDFVSCMSGLEQVKLFGDQTGGGGSIPNAYMLANGWLLQYSSSVTLSPDKITVENGILPDVNILISALQEANGVDPIIDQAFLTLK